MPTRPGIDASMRTERHRRGDLLLLVDDEDRSDPESDVDPWVDSGCSNTWLSPWLQPATARWIENVTDDYGQCQGHFAE